MCMEILVRFRYRFCHHSGDGTMQLCMQLLLFTQTPHLVIRGTLSATCKILKWIDLDLDHGWPLVKKQGKSSVYVVLLINRRASEHCWVVSNLVAYSFLFTVFDKLVSLFMARCWFATITLNLKTINEVWTTSAEIAHILLWQNEPRNLHHPNQLWIGKTFVFITTNQVVWPTIPNVS